MVLAKLLCPALISLKPSLKLHFDDIWAGTYGTFCKVANKNDIYVFGLNNYYQLGRKTSKTPNVNTCLWNIQIKTAIINLAPVGSSILLAFIICFQCSFVVYGANFTIIIYFHCNSYLNIPYNRFTEI